MGLLLLGAAFQSFALTIGRPSGNAWVGKPLDLVVPLELDRSDAGDGLCLEADVRQGDTRVEDKRVILSLDPGPSPDAPRVHLRTTRAIEEPVITVKLTAGCVTKSTRQYVLLADLPEPPPVVASPARPALAPAANATGGARDQSAPLAPSRPARVARAQAGQVAGSSNGAEAVSEAAPPPRKRVAPAPVMPKPNPAVAEAVPKPPSSTTRTQTAVAPASPADAAKEGKPRLQVEPLSPEPVTQVAPKPALASPEPEDPARRVQAQSPPQPVSAATAEQNQRDAERMKEMESALTSLREQSAQTQRQLLEMRGELAQAQASRYRNPLVYGLLALIALALIALALLWRAARRAHASAWWGADEQGPGGDAARPVLPRRGELLEEEDEADDEAGSAARADVSGLRSAQGLRVTALPAGLGASAFDRGQVRQVNAEELFDVQQQSEFFVSLGQHEQAIGVLREHIAANPGTSALAYLDLLGVLHLLGRRDDYAALAREFGHKFNAQVPDFENYSAEGRSLEHYRDALARIMERWPSQGTAELIEEFVFRKPDSHDESFDLPAYQELLLLYAVARDLSEYAGPWAVPVHVPAAPSAVRQRDSGAYVRSHQETAPTPCLTEAPEAASAAQPVPSRAMLPLELDLAELDRTAFETLPAPIESPPAQKPGPGPSDDPHVIDFDPSDPATDRGALRPRHLGVKR